MQGLSTADGACCGSVGYNKRYAKCCSSTLFTVRGSLRYGGWEEVHVLVKDSLPRCTLRLFG